MSGQACHSLRSIPEVQLGVREGGGCPSSEGARGGAAAWLWPPELSASPPPPAPICCSPPRFIPRHEDELELDVDDPILVELEEDDYWYRGYNMRTGERGIFPAFYAHEVVSQAKEGAGELGGRGPALPCSHRLQGGGTQSIIPPSPPTPDLSQRSPRHPVAVSRERAESTGEREAVLPSPPRPALLSPLPLPHGCPPPPTLWCPGSGAGLLCFLTPAAAQTLGTLRGQADHSTRDCNQ